MKVKFLRENGEQVGITARMSDDPSWPHNIRSLLMDMQQYTGSADLTAVNADTGEKLARMRYELLGGDE